MVNRSRASRDSATRLRLVAAEGEGQKVEFKVRATGMAREMVAFAIKGGRVRFDEQFLPECDPGKDLDKGALDAFRRQRNLPRGARSADVLVNLGVAQYQAGRPLLTRAAVVFFGREPQRFIPEAYVTCARYADATRSSILDRLDAKGNLLGQYRAAVAFLQRNLPTRYRIETAGPRREALAIPDAALREALLNALTHRDYFADTEHVFVHAHPDRVEITNPGGLPPGLTLQDLGTRAVPRNRLIADLFYRMGYVERLGSGIHRMRQAMAQAELPPPVFQPTADAFRVILFSAWEGLGLSSQEELAARWMSARAVATAAELATQLKVSGDTSRRVLARLIGRGWVQQRGKRRGAVYTWTGAEQ